MAALDHSLMKHLREKLQNTATTSTRLMHVLTSQKYSRLVSEPASDGRGYDGSKGGR